MAAVNPKDARDRSGPGTAGAEAVDGAASPVTRTLRRYKRIGLDTICFIYHLSKHPEYFPITSELFRLIEQGRVAAVTSSASNPGIAYTGIPMASRNCLHRSICGRRSSGIGLRVAL